MNKYVNKKFILICIFLICKCKFCISSEIKDYKYSNWSYYCNNRIYVDNNFLSSKEINKLCEQISDNDIFLIDLITINKDENFNLDELAKKFHNSNCKNNKFNNCLNAITICIFITDEIKVKGHIRIIYGENSQSIEQNIRNAVINSMINNLNKRKFYDALVTAINLLGNYYNEDNSQEERKFPEHIPEKNESHFSFFKFLFYIVIPIILFYYLWKWYQKKNNQSANENNQNANEHLINNFPNINELNNNNNNNYTNNNLNNSEIIIHNHIASLCNLIYQIRNNNNNLSINVCLLCMRPLYTNNQNIIEMSQINSNNNFNSYDMKNEQIKIMKFGCFHIYHYNCLRKCNKFNCLMCGNDPRYNNVLHNTSYEQFVNENQILSLIMNFNVIYNEFELKSYINKYENEYNNINIQFFSSGNLNIFWFNNNIQNPYNA